MLVAGEKWRRQSYKWHADESIIVPHINQPPQQTARVPAAARMSRDHCCDVTVRPTTVSGRCFRSAVVHQPNSLTQRAKIGLQPQINAPWSSDFGRKGVGNQRQTLCQAKWQPRINNEACIPLPAAKNRQNFTHRLGGREPRVNADWRAERQRINCDKRPVVSREASHAMAKPGARSHNLRNSTRQEPKVERSKLPNDGESSTAGGSDGADGNIAALGGDCSTSRSSRDSVRTSVTWYNGDDVRQVRGRSARTSGVFSRMSTEAQQAWIDIKRSGRSAASGDRQPEAESSSHADSTTSGLGGRQATANDHVAPRDGRRRRAERRPTTKETAYNVFKAGSSERDHAPVNGTPTHHAHPRCDSRHASRAVGNFRITSAAYDSRFVDMASAESRRQSHNCVTADQADEGDYKDDDGDDDAEIRAASVAKCLLWLRQHYQ